MGRESGLGVRGSIRREVGEKRRSPLLRFNIRRVVVSMWRESPAPPLSGSFWIGCTWAGYWAYHTDFTLYLGFWYVVVTVPKIKGRDVNGNIIL